ncbi:MAG: peptidase papain [Cyanobacteria bacterium RYN_339]|nr:peptidase papain [Cyanobacteria bacterium RYN_339]
MKRRIPTIVLLAALAVAPTGCSSVVTAITGNPALVGALVEIAAGQLLPPPKNGNKNLAPIFLKALSGQSPTLDQVSQILQLCNGLLVGKLPAKPGMTTVGITTGGVSAFGLLGTGSHFHIKGTGTSERVGTGGYSPKAEDAVAKAAPSLFDNAPIFAALLGAGQYRLEGVADVTDLRPQMPPIRSQGQRGTCVFFATTGIVDYMYSSKGLPIKHASPQFMDWLYQMEVKSKVPDMQSEAWQDTGTSHAAWFPLLHIDGNREVTESSPYIPPEQGYLSEEQCPYNKALKDNKPDVNLLTVSKAHLGDALATKIANKEGFASQGAYFFRVKNDQPSFEAALAGGQPIQISFAISGEDWDEPTADNNFQIPEMTEAKAADESSIGYHSVAIVGYERNSSAPGGGWYIVRNSWGTNWGDQGYCRVSYKSTHEFASSSWVATPYARSFNAAYDLAPPPTVAPPADQVLKDRPLPAPDAQSESGGYTTDDRNNSESIDQLFASFLTELGKLLK